MLMHAAQRVRVSRAVSFLIANFLHPLLLKAVGVTGGKLDAGEKIDNRRVTHLAPLERRPAADERGIAQPRNGAALVDELSERCHFGPTKIAMDVRDVQAHSELRGEII